MRIIVDAFGGDNAPLEVLKGCAQAVAEYGVEITVTGDEAAIRRVAEQNGVSLDHITVVHAPNVIPVEVDPVKIRREYADCSMAVGLKLLAQGEGEAFVSAGSTGALVVGSTLFVKRVKGIKRIAIGTLVPNAAQGYLLIDTGANHECRPEMLQQFAVMGAVYMEKIRGVKNPRVGLINIGTEENKGNQLQIDALALLKNTSLNFTGNVEARGLPLGEVDVAVCDGFTGNIVLKTTEGMGKFFSGELKRMLKSFPGVLALPFLARGLSGIRHKTDASEAGGAPLLGLTKTVVKAHGNSDARAFKNAIRQARDMVENRVIDQIEAALLERQAQEETAQA